MIEQERIEDNGIGDELMEMQEMIWLIKQLRAKYFAIDISNLLQISTARKLRYLILFLSDF